MTDAKEPAWYVKQKHDWDCGVACVAMALRLSYEDALAQLPERRSKNGYYPGEIAKFFDTATWHGGGYKGSIEKCILQVMGIKNNKSHFVYVEGGLWCPAGKYAWGMFTICTIIPVQPITNGDDK